MITTTCRIEGMTCAHCVRAVTEELSAINGVQGVDVDLHLGTATVTSTVPLTDAALREAIDEAGYDLSAIAVLSA